MTRPAPRHCIHPACAGIMLPYPYFESGRLTVLPTVWQSSLRFPQNISPFATRWSWVCRSGKCTPAELTSCEVRFSRPGGAFAILALRLSSLQRFRDGLPCGSPWFVFPSGKTISCQPTPLTLRSRHPATLLVLSSESTHRYLRYLSQA